MCLTIYPLLKFKMREKTKHRKCLREALYPFLCKVHFYNKKIFFFLSIVHVKFDTMLWTKKQK